MNSYQFFLRHAGYSYNPKTESPMQGRIKCARQLAKAERQARDAGISYQWEVNRYCLSSDWVDDNDDGGRNCNPWATWQCVAYNPGEDFQERPSIAASLSGIDFGRDGEPWGNPYRRVAEAELALEALQEVQS